VREKHGLCPAHLSAARKRVDERRESANDRGYTWRWRKAREIYLRQHPLCECEECRALGRIMPATVVDHRTPHRGDMRLFWDQSNWQAMSKRCHDRKTVREDGGFGNAGSRHDARQPAGARRGIR
jgi:5-methylcytosine-specific restriction protein A